MSIIYNYMFEEKIIFKNVGGINEKFRGFRNPIY